MRRGGWWQRAGSRSARGVTWWILRGHADRYGSDVSSDVLRAPAPDRDDVVRWVERHLGAVLRGPVVASPLIGGQSAADAALARLDISGYAQRRNEVYPRERRGASGLSPYIRHGLLSLPHVWRSVDGPPQDRAKFRDELLWQEYARHLYARLGAGTRHSLRFSVSEYSDHDGPGRWADEGLCVAESLRELRETGWITNQQRMWLASHWTIREGNGWRAGEDDFFRALLDGSRAANRLGWQWTVGALTGKPYGFSRWQVTHRAPGLCDRCSLRANCPIEEWPEAGEPVPRTVVDPRMRRDPDPESTAGPRDARVIGEPDAVWITAESLGDGDPALAAHPDVPVIFVFDRALLTHLRLSAARLVFLTECLADLAERRDLQIHIDDPRVVLADTRIACTFTPVPGWRARSARLDIVALHPWPWLRAVGPGPLTSFSAWQTSSRASGRGRSRR